MVENPNMEVLQISPSGSPWGYPWVLECFCTCKIFGRVDVKVVWEGLFRYALFEKATLVTQGPPPWLVDSSFTANLWAQPNSCLLLEGRPGQARKGAKKGQRSWPCVCVCSVVSDSLKLTSFSVHGIFQTRIPEWVAISISFSRESSRPRDQTHVSCVSCTGRRVLYSWCHLTLDMSIAGVALRASELGFPQHGPSREAHPHSSTSRGDPENTFFWERTKPVKWMQLQYQDPFITNHELKWAKLCAVLPCYKQPWVNTLGLPSHPASWSLGFTSLDPYFFFCNGNVILCSSFRALSRRWN